jgi:predicted RNA-binding Zn-ribbon protein involved in translation (DUF1610 family)
MTSDIGSDLGLEKVVERQFVFHCSCGAAIETSETMVTCCECGETVEIRGRVPTAKGTKYTLRISKHRRDVTPEPFSGLPVSQPSASWHPVVHRQEALDRDQLFPSRTTVGSSPPHHEISDPEKKSLHLGLLILLLTALSIIAYSVPGDQEWSALARSPRPRDCDWSSTPCHYESSFRSVHDGNGEHLVVIWQRVVD